jgi:hypothetical protein
MRIIFHAVWIMEQVLHGQPPGPSMSYVPYRLTLHPCGNTIMEKFMGILSQRKKKKRGHAYKTELKLNTGYTL